MDLMLQLVSKILIILSNWYRFQVKWKKELALSFKIWTQANHMGITKKSAALENLSMMNWDSYYIFIQLAYLDL